MISKKQKKFLIIGFTICALLGSGYTASAVYPVHDSRVYAQIVAQIKKVTEQINTIKQQIALQKQHLYDLGWGKIGPIIKDIQQHRDVNCRIGSLEKELRFLARQADVNCRIGSLERFGLV